MRKQIASAVSDAITMVVKVAVLGILSAAVVNAVGKMMQKLFVVGVPKVMGM